MNKLKRTAYMFLLWTFVTMTISGCAGKDKMYLEAKAQDDAAGPGSVTGVDSGQEEGTAMEDTASSDGEDFANETYFVYVCGAVNEPGVFELPAGSRIYEAIALAGGLRKDASPKGINQAQLIADGDMIEVLTVQEQQEAEEAESAPSGAQDGRIDINTASAAELMTLNGIGEAKAANIIAYRESNGKFSAVEELMNVNGIGEGVYAKVKDKITVTK